MTSNRALSPKKRIALLVLALVMMLSVFTVSAMASDYSNHWAREYIKECTNRGWITGYEDGTFKPNNSITRAEFSVMVWRALDKPTASGTNPFSDVIVDSWYYNAVLSLYSRGIVTGMGDGTFAPNATITREMGVTMLARAFQLSASDTTTYTKYSDSADISTWARNGVSALTELGYLSGVGNNLCAPKNNLTRAETAKLLLSVVDEISSTPTGPKITLAYDPATSSSVEITVTATGTVAFIGYRESASGTVYNSTSGFTNITSAGKFTVTKNGWYAVCATDTAGNFSYVLVEITNVSSGSGGTGGIPGGNPDITKPVDSENILVSSFAGVTFVTVKTTDSPKNVKVTINGKTYDAVKQDTANEWRYADTTGAYTKDVVSATAYYPG